MSFIAVSAQQTNVEISKEYVMDAETGKLIRIVQPTDDYYNYETSQPVTQTIVVKETTSSAQQVLDAASAVIRTGLVVGTVAHLLKHPHHHHYHSFHHHHHRPVYHVPAPPRHHHHKHGRRR